MAFGQLYFVNKIGSKLLVDQLFSTGWQLLFSVLSSLSLPLFVIASFGLVMSGSRPYKNILLLYGVAFISVGIGVNIFYYRYVNGLFQHLGFPDYAVEFVNNFLNERVEVNVFADLFMFALLHYFINYQPTKYFQGRNIKVFRLGSIIPIAYVLTSYILKIVVGVGKINMSFFLYPFLTTKSPLVFALFVAASLWIKNREKIFTTLGFTKSEYNDFIQTRRSSLSFSAHLSILIVVFFLVELFGAFIFAIIYMIIKGTDFDNFGTILNAFGFGQVGSLLLAIPIIFLYSYTRTEKNNTIDIFVPIGGISLIVLIYIESIYQVILEMVSY